jgi:siderophore synthetase component
MSTSAEALPEPVRPGGQRTPIPAPAPAGDEPSSARAHPAHTEPEHPRAGAVLGASRHPGPQDDIASDPLLDPSPSRAADHAAIENLLRCRIRESGTALTDDGTLRLPLPATASTVVAPILYGSETGMHRFGPVRLSSGVALDATTLAVLLAIEAAHGRVGSITAIADMTDRVIDSTRRIAHHLAERRKVPEDAPGTTPFLSTEQSIVLGHPLHPSPASRQGMYGPSSPRYSPELRGSFALHWFAVDPSVAVHDGDLGLPVPVVLAALAEGGVDFPPGTIALPAHPWQARDVLSRPGVAALLDRGLLRDLGPGGPAWSATSSIRTVYRTGAAVMLKTSLGVEITNSRRENHRSELRRGLAVHRMLDAGLKRVMHSAHPGFDVLRDLGWIAVDIPGGRGESGLELVVRDNPFGPRDRVHCIAGLAAPRPDLPRGRSMLAEVLYTLAARTATPLRETAESWFRRYLDVLVAPILWLHGEYGLGLEAHQQNTLVVLDTDGRPIGGRYRGNQGYYFSAERGARLARWLPGAGRDLGTWCPDHVIDERLGYYLAINNVLGLVGAMGAQNLADERALIKIFRERLVRTRADHPAGRPLVDRLLDGATLRCKANLLTRVAGLDELEVPLEAQSVYVDIPNPIADVRG